MKKQKENLVQFDKLPTHLISAATEKAKRFGYNEKEAKRLFFNVQDNKLADGVIEKNFKF